MLFSHCVFQWIFRNKVSAQQLKNCAFNENSLFPSMSILMSGWCSMWPMRNCWNRFCEAGIYTIAVFSCSINIDSFFSAVRVLLAHTWRQHTSDKFKSKRANVLLPHGWKTRQSTNTLMRVLVKRNKRNAKEADTEI